jgi:hypothetical protein
MSRACKTHRQALFATLKTKSLRQTFSCQVLKEFAKTTPTYLLELMTSVEFSPPSLPTLTHTFSLSLSLFFPDQHLWTCPLLTYHQNSLCYCSFIKLWVCCFWGSFFLSQNTLSRTQNSHPPLTLTPGELS